MKRPKVGVIGLGGQSAFLQSDHFPVPGETVHATQLFFELGGKGYNQAVACARMGVDTLFVGAVGADENGRLCREDLEKEEIEALLFTKPQPTAYAVITTVPGGENTVQVFGGAAKLLTPEDIHSVEEKLAQCDYLLLQNELSLACLEAAVNLGQKYQIPVILNPAPAGGIPLELVKKCMLVTPNYAEARELVGIAPKHPGSEWILANAFCRLRMPDTVVTWGSRGSMLLRNGQMKMINSVFAGPPVDTTGAGDTFNGVLTACLAQGVDLEKACRMASVAAGICVTRPGARSSIPYRQEVEKLAAELE